MLTPVSPARARARAISAVRRWPEVSTQKSVLGCAFSSNFNMAGIRSRGSPPDSCTCPTPLFWKCATMPCRSSSDSFSLPFSASHSKQWAHCMAHFFVIASSRIFR